MSAESEINIADRRPVSSVVRQTHMQIDSIDFKDSVLTVRCSGVFGYGSEGNPSGALLVESIEQWMRAHPDQRFEELVVDYTGVEYCWGDAPVWSAMRFISKGVALVRLIAGPQNLKPLQDLVKMSRVPWFVVEEPSD